MSKRDHDDDDFDIGDLYLELCDDARIFTLADLSQAMRRGVQLGFSHGCNIMYEMIDDDLERREVVERPDVLRRLRDKYDKMTELVKGSFRD